MIALVALLVILTPPKQPSLEAIIKVLEPKIGRIIQAKVSNKRRAEMIDDALIDSGQYLGEKDHRVLASDGLQILKVANADDQMIVPFADEDLYADYDTESQGWVLFEPRGRSYIGTRLKIEEGIDIQSAVRLGNTLVIAGRTNLECNMPGAGFAALKMNGNQWKTVRYKNTWNDVYEIPKLRPSKDGKSILPVTVTVHTYPSYIEMCHADSQILVDYRWTFPNGLPSCKTEIVRDTPLNALDDLVKAIQNRDWKAIRRKSRTVKIARRLARLADQMELRRFAGHDRPDGLIARNSDKEYCRDFVLNNLGVGCHFSRHRGRWVVSRIETFEPYEWGER